MIFFKGKSVGMKTIVVLVNTILVSIDLTTTFNKPHDIPKFWTTVVNVDVDVDIVGFETESH